MAWNRHARGNVRKRTVRGVMNDMEARYANHLELLKKAGEIEWFAYEGIRFRLADGDKAFYTPDFAVMLPDGLIEIHEVKGHWEQHALLQIKWCADKYPFKFIAIQEGLKRDGRPYTYRSFGGDET